MDGVHARRDGDSRTTPRSNMFLAAVLQGPGSGAPVKLRNMSPMGALVEAASPPLAGDEVHVVRGSLRVAAVVAWSGKGRCGLRFLSPVIVREWLAPPGNAAQRRVDDAVRIMKLGAVPLGSSGRQSASGPAAPALSELGADLQRAARLVEGLANELAGDKQVLANHLHKLQNADLAVQLICVVAATLISGGDGSTAERLKNLRASALEAASH
jgi:hypothetical protein